MDEAPSRDIDQRYAQLLLIGRTALTGIAAAGFLQIATLDPMPDLTTGAATSFALALPVLLTSYGVDYLSKGENLPSKVARDLKMTSTIQTLFGGALALAGVDFLVVRVSEQSGGWALPYFYRAFVALSLLTLAGTYGKVRANRQRGRGSSGS